MITFLFFTRFPISAPCMFPPPSSCGAVGICPDPCEAGSAPPCSLSPRTVSWSPPSFSDPRHRCPETVDMPVTVQHVRHHGLVADRVDHYAVWFRITLPADSPHSPPLASPIFKCSTHRYGYPHLSDNPCANKAFLRLHMRVLRTVVFVFSVKRFRKTVLTRHICIHPINGYEQAIP